ncbi:MAG TPA: phosphatase PAP2 family protein [Jatrophihabitans sp.]|nr:phosphatase PAP2 family protein [Jatrophihabitans sp.]
MHDVALTWQQAGWLTAGLAATSAALTWGPVGRARALAPFARETTVIAGLYSLWQLAGTLSVLGTDGAYARGRWVEHAERTLHLPSEAALQRATTGRSEFVAQAANVYYATMHFGGLFVFLLWLFVRHRDRYRPVRRVLALTTLVCLLIQLVPVAPPRLLPQFGYVDTAAKYNLSVYNNGFGADALSAMPSVHVAWAVLVGWTVWRLGSRAGRWIGPAHTVVTVFVVVATANHFWADGIVAVAVLLACAGLERAGRAAVASWQRRRAPAAVTPCYPAAAAAAPAPPGR